MNPAAIRDQRFLLVRRGYDPEAVLSFLDEVADALEAAQAAAAGDGDPAPGAIEVADADRLVDEARTRAATHRLRAQRDIDALHRTARARRARLVAEIEELAVARNQLSDDLDRAVDVVDRVVQWVRRTDPTADPTSAGTVLADPGRDPGADHVEVAAPLPPDAAGPTDAGPPANAVEPAVAAVEPAPTVDELDLAGPLADQAARDDREPSADEVEIATSEEPVGAADGRAGDDAEAAASGEPAAPDDVPSDVADAGDDGAIVALDEPERGADDAAEVAPGIDERAPDPPAPPGGEAIRQALRAVQDEVLGNLRDRPRGSVDDWVPSATVLLALDDAATDACGRAFLAGWEESAPEITSSEESDGLEPSAAAARDALEEVRGAGALPGLGIADDLRVAVRASLQRGVDEGDAPPQLVERMAEVHRDVRQTVVVAALDEVTSAARHHGLVARWRHDEVPAIAWVLGEERRCPGRRCRANASDGVVAPGETFPFGEVVPPAHPGCTCTLRRAEPDEVPTGA